MPVFQIEMLWDCRVCKQVRNRGLQRHCRSCGHPKDDRDVEYLPDHVTIRDALAFDQARDAQAGPDWKCKFCESLQGALHKCCTECGAPKGQGGKAWDAKEVEATFDPATGAQTSASESEAHVDAPPADAPWKEAEAAATSSAPPAADAPAEAPIPSTIPVSSDREPLDPALWVLVPGLVILVGLLVWILFRTKIHDVRVSSATWEHEVLIDRYQVWHRDGWDPGPGAFDVHDDGRRVHHTDHVLVGHHSEPYTAREACGQACRTIPGSCHTTAVHCRPNKNGSATCSGGDRVCSPDREACTPKYCDVPRSRIVDDYEDQPRYRDYYDWDVWDWGHNRTVTHSGASTDESWPSDDELKPAYLGDGEQERQAGRKTTHRVTFAQGEDTWSITPDSCAEFERFSLGSPWRVKVGVAHGVEVLPPR